MQKVRVGDLELSISPRKLINYIEKVQFIKSRRPTPWDLMKGVPKTLSVADYTAYVETAMKTVYTHASAVGIQEEIDFDTSPEGFFWTLWKCMVPDRASVKKKVTMAEASAVQEPWEAGLLKARALWEAATDDEKRQIRMALDASDQMRQVKNSDGPPETNSPEAGPKE